MSSRAGARLKGEGVSSVRQQFASDNIAGMCPEVVEAFEKANGTGHEVAYGEDSWTQMVCDRIRNLFQTDCEVFFVFNGTAANSLALSALCNSYHSVIAHELAHVETDECGGPEFFSNGSKILLAKGENGKLTPDAIETLVTKRSDIHYPKPKVVSLTQATEVGHRLFGRGTACHRGDRQAAGPADPHGRGAIRQCGGDAGRASVRDHLAGGDRRAVLRWHQERSAGR